MLEEILLHDSLNLHLVAAVDFHQVHLHALRQRRRQVLADVVGFDRQLAMAAIDEDHQLDGARAAELDQRIERGANRPSGVEHIVDEQNAFLVDRKRNLGSPNHWLGTDRMTHEIVAIQRDVERAGGNLALADLADALRQPLGERDAARADADERQFFDAAIAFEDFVGDAGERTTHSLGIHDDRHEHLFASSQGRVKENGGDYSIARLASRSSRVSPRVRSPSSATPSAPHRRALDRPGGSPGASGSPTPAPVWRSAGCGCRWPT